MFPSINVELCDNLKLLVFHGGWAIFKSVEPQTLGWNEAKYDFQRSVVLLGDTRVTTCLCDANNKERRTRETLNTRLPKPCLALE